MGKLINITGHKFGMLEIMEFCESKMVGKKKRRFYRAKCDCGKTVVVQAESVRSGACQSCGCLRSRSGAANPKWTGCGEISGELWANIISKAKKESGRRSRDINFSITLQEVWDLFLSQDGRCALTGLKLSFSDGRKVPRTASLDRIDSNKGYEIGNVQWVHKTVNIMKQSFSQAEFIDFCHKTSDYQRGLDHGK